mmetsp:Transcript_24209/g.47598  ORF Transcript_24209/g.47598 Transcript_24209/m.47598 type:complete len:191 (+) Transcript_24209:161-733(+)
MCDAPPLRLHHINLRFSLGCEPDPRKLLFAARFAEYDQDTRTVWLRFKSHGGLTAMFTEKGDVLMRVRGPLEKAKSRACAIAAFVKQRSEPKAHFLNYRVTALNLSCRLPFRLRLNRFCVLFGVDMELYVKDSDREQSGIRFISPPPYNITVRVEQSGVLMLENAKSLEDAAALYEKLWAAARQAQDTPG